MQSERHRAPHILYKIMKQAKNPGNCRSLLKMIHIVALPENHYNNIPCVLCRRQYSDIVCHLIADCPALYQERNILWDYIIDSVDIY